MRIRVILLSLFVFIAGVSSDAEALHRSSGREASGTVESIDRATQMITVMLDSPHKGSDRLEVKWGSLTKGFEGGERVTMDRLRPATQVTIRYITPLFGPSVLRRISWCEEKAGCQRALQ